MPQHVVEDDGVEGTLGQRQVGAEEALQHTVQIAAGSVGGADVGFDAPDLDAGPCLLDGLAERAGVAAHVQHAQALLRQEGQHLPAGQVGVIGADQGAGVRHGTSGGEGMPLAGARSLASARDHWNP